jgi:hypothetical protein
VIFIHKTINKIEKPFMTNFDLFRLNCFLNDTQANDFKRIIISLVCEYIFENKNEEVKLEDCYKHIINYHKLEVDKDYFTSIVTTYKSIEQIPLQNDISIKLTSKKFAEIYDKLKEHSIDIYIEKFLRKNNYSVELKEPIKSLLYQAVFENISTFSTENLTSLISTQIQNKFNNDEIEKFNEFLEDPNHEKNTAVYNVFLKATEFAIITSGKGVKEFSKDLFNGKRYCLDTNILFRLLGIGGFERQNTLIDLLKSCNHQGITFEYTSETHQELRKTLAGSVKYLKVAEKKYDIIALGELTASDPQLFNEDFVLHYSKLRAKGLVNNPDQYELKLLADFRTLENQLGFGLTKGNVAIDEKEKIKLSDYLFKSKKELPYGSRYTKTAANIDSYNILFVRKIRDVNNYNYIDVKSFYLTTDRTLNVVLSKKDDNIIPETILPSQLFILHHPYTSNGEKVDYELFLQFVKRRTTEFHLKGSEVLTYINQIRKQTSSKTELRNILLVYADKRYEVSNDHNIEERKVRPLQEILDTIIDKKLEKGKADGEELNIIKQNANNYIPIISRKTKLAVRVLDILLTIIIIPLTILIVKDINKDLEILVGATLVVEGIKFMITSKTRIWNYVWKIFLTFKLKNSNYYKLTEDENYITLGFEEYKKLDGEIWKRK